MPHITPLPIGLTETGDPVSLYHDHLTAGVAIVGVSGAGKTHLLRRIAAHWQDTPDHSTTLIDPCGDLAPGLDNTTRSLDYSATAEQPRINLLDPATRRNDPALESITASIAAAAQGEWDPRREDILRYFIQLGVLQNRALPESQVSLHDIFLAVSNSVDQPMPPIFTQRFQPAAKGTNPGRWLDHFLNWPDTTRNHALRPLAEHLKLFTPTRAAEQALSHDKSDPPPTSGNIAIYPAPDSLGDHTAALIGSFLAQTHTPKATASRLLACDGLDLFPALQHSDRAEPNERQPIAVTVQTPRNNPPLSPLMNRLHDYRTWAIFRIMPDTLAQLRTRYDLSDLDLPTEPAPRQHFTLITDAGPPSQRVQQIRPLPRG